MNFDLEDEDSVNEIKNIVTQSMINQLVMSYKEKGIDVEFEIEDVKTQPILEEMKETNTPVTIDNLMRVISQRVKNSKFIYTRK